MHIQCKSNDTASIKQGSLKTCDVTIKKLYFKGKKGRTTAI